LLIKNSSSLDRPKKTKGVHMHVCVDVHGIGKKEQQATNSRMACLTKT